jgi:hypothetical protein
MHDAELMISNVRAKQQHLAISGSDSVSAAS